MIIMSIYISIILCYVILVCGIAFLYYEISEEEREAKQMKNNLQAEVSRLKEVVYNNKRLDSIYIKEDKNMSNCERTMVVNLLRKIINNLYDLSDNHLVEYNDIERTINLAKTAESIIKK